MNLYVKPTPWTLSLTAEVGLGWNVFRHSKHHWKLSNPCINQTENHSILSTSPLWMPTVILLHFIAAPHGKCNWMVTGWGPLGDNELMESLLGCEITDDSYIPILPPQGLICGKALGWKRGWGQNTFQGHSIDIVKGTKHRPYSFGIMMMVSHAGLIIQRERGSHLIVWYS